jgi:hypothetical protein
VTIDEGQLAKVTIDNNAFKVDTVFERELEGLYVLCFWPPPLHPEAFLLASFTLLMLLLSHFELPQVYLVRHDFFGMMPTVSVGGVVLTKGRWYFELKVGVKPKFPARLGLFDLSSMFF